MRESLRGSHDINTQTRWAGGPASQVLHVAVQGIGGALGLQVLLHVPGSQRQADVEADAAHSAAAPT